MRTVEIDWMFRGGAAALFPQVWSKRRDLLRVTLQCLLVGLSHHLEHHLWSGGDTFGVNQVHHRQGESSLQNQRWSSPSFLLIPCMRPVPEAWSSFVGILDEQEQSDPLLAYYSRLTSESDAVRSAAVRKTRLPTLPVSL